MTYETEAVWVPKANCEMIHYVYSDVVPLRQRMRRPCATPEAKARQTQSCRGEVTLDEERLEDKAECFEKVVRIINIFKVL